MGVGELVPVVGGAEDVEAAVVGEGVVEEEEGGVVSTLGIPSFMDSDDSNQVEGEANRGSQYHLTADTMFRYLL